MSNEQLYIDEIDAYLQGKLNPEEMATFDEKLKSNPSFNEAFHNQKLLSALIQENARLELKDYLNTHAKTKVISSSNWLQSKVFAIAATAIILIGAFVVFQFYSSPKLEQNLAIQTSNPIPETKSKDSITERPHLGILETEVPLSEKDMLNEITPPIPEERKDVDMESMDDAPPAIDVSSEDLTFETDSKYGIAHEINIKDTFLYATSLTMLDLNGSKETYGSSRKTESKSAQLPAPITNSNQAKALEDTKKSIDTLGLSKSKIAKKQNVKTKYTVEFWSSPINFKGYKYGNNIIQLFGLKDFNCKLYTVNGSLYLRHLDKVYQILPCLDGCPYKLEVDPDIVQFILNQN